MFVWRALKQKTIHIKYDVILYRTKSLRWLGIIVNTRNLEASVGEMSIKCLCQYGTFLSKGY